MSLLGKTIGQFHIVELVGKGGMGEVYVGFDEKLQRRVALKTIRGQKRWDDKSRARFVREAQVLSQLEHPNICRIYDLVEAPDCDLLVLELIKGDNLDHAVGQGLSFKSKLKIARQIAEALAAAHAQQIIHRDIKPSNIMLTAENGVKVLDFGLAHSQVNGDTWPIDQDDMASGSYEDETSICEIPGIGFRTAHGVVTGTPRYMSPEQANGKSLTAASDMYSVGLLLQWLFTEKPAYLENLTAPQLLFRASLGKTQPVEGLSQDLTELIARLKSVSPDLRPTAIEVRDRLKWIEQKPKRRARALAVAVVLFSLVLGTTLSTFGFWRARIAERHAIQSKEEAEQSRAEQAAVNEFLKDMLSAANPKKLGVDVRVVELLDHAAKTADINLADQVKNQAEVIHTLGLTYEAIGEYEKAQDQLLKSLALKKKILGNQHIGTVKVQRQYGQLLRKQGKLLEAESVFQSVLKTCTAVYGTEDRDTIAAMANLANVYIDQSRFDKAESLIIDALESVRPIMGDHRDLTNDLLNNAGVLFFYQGKFDKALKYFEQTLELRRAAFGEAHPDTIDSMSNLAAVLLAKGAYPEAESYNRDILKLRTKLYGAIHPTTLTSQSNLAKVLFYLKRFDEAEVLQREVLRERKIRLGDEHPHTLDSVGCLAQIFCSQGRHEEGEALFRLLLDSMKRVMGPEHLRTLMCMSNLAESLRCQSKFQEALEAGREVVAIYSRVSGEHHPHTLNALANLSAVLDEIGDFEEAKTLAQNVLQARRRVLGEDHPETLDSTVFLGTVLEHSGEIDQAVACYRPAAEKGSVKAIAALKRLGLNP